MTNNFRIGSSKGYYTGRPRPFRFLSFIAVAFLILQMGGVVFAESGQKSTDGDTRNSITGTLVVIERTPSKGFGKSTTEYSLIDSQGVRHTLSLDPKISGSLNLVGRSGQKVTVTGSMISPASDAGGTLISAQAVTFKANSQAEPPIRGSKPFLSVACKFGDIAAEPQNVDFFKGQLSGTPFSFNNFIKEVSYGQVNLEGSNAVGWFTLPQPRSFYVKEVSKGGGEPKLKADLDAIVQDCYTAATKQGTDFTPYFGVNFMFNANLDNSAYGTASSPLPPNDPNGKLYAYTMMPYAPAEGGATNGDGWETQAILGHEISHSFRSPHTGSSTGDEYGNSWDVVSKSEANCPANTDKVYGCISQYPAGVNLEMMNFFPNGRVVTYDPALKAQTYTLERLEQPTTSNPQLLKIPVNGNEKYYTVEARYRVGFDTKLPGDAVIIHDVDMSRKSGPKGPNSPLGLIVPRPDAPSEGSRGIGDVGAMWNVGSRFEDKANNISITVKSATPTGFVVIVNDGQSADVGTKIAPTDAANPQFLPSFKAGQQTTLKASVTNYGPQDSPNEKASLPIPAGLKLIAANPEVGTYDAASQIWNIGFLKNGQTVSMTLTVLVETDAPVILTVTSEEEGEEDENSDNDTASFVINGTGADLKVSTDASDYDPFVGKALTLTVTASNFGPNPSGAAKIKTLVPDGMSLVSAKANIGKYDAANGLWEFGNLDNGQDAKLEMEVMVKEARSFSFKAEKIAQATIDPRAKNDKSELILGAINEPFYAFIDTSPVGPEDGEIQFKPTPVGKAVTYDLKLSNLGTAPLKIYRVSFDGPDSADFSVVGPVVPLAIAPGDSQTLTLQCKPSVAGERYTQMVIKNNDEGLPTAIYDVYCSNFSQATVTPSAQLRVNSNPADGTLSYSFNVASGPEGIADPMIRFPVDSALMLAYATGFNDPSMWVSKIATENGQLYVYVSFSGEPDSTFSGTLVFRAASKATAGATVATRYTLSWTNQDALPERIGSNLVRATLGADTTNDGGLQSFSPATASAGKGSTVQLTADFYASGEQVTFWYTDKNNNSIAIGSAYADNNGNLTFKFDAKDLMAGQSYTIAGYGSASGVTGNMLLTVNP